MTLEQTNQLVNDQMELLISDIKKVKFTDFEYPNPVMDLHCNHKLIKPSDVDLDAVSYYRFNLDISNIYGAKFEYEFTVLNNHRLADVIKQNMTSLFNKMVNDIKLSIRYIHIGKIYIGNIINGRNFAQYNDHNLIGYKHDSINKPLSLTLLYHDGLELELTPKFDLEKRMINLSEKDGKNESQTSMILGGDLKDMIDVIYKIHTHN